MEKLRAKRVNGTATEIPPHLKKLYKHWPDHTQVPSRQRIFQLNPHILAEMTRFASERMRIWAQKTTGLTPPYTSDPILAKYRFCNVYRELDRQTIEFHSLLKDLEGDFDTWLLNLAFCRMVASPDTVRKTGLLSYNRSQNLRVWKCLTSLTAPKYGTAYVFPVSAILKTQFPTREEFFCLYLPFVMQKCATVISGLGKASVVDALNAVLPLFGFNLKFHWTEILIDVAYQYPKYIDLFKRFPIGPGSRPTMIQLNPQLSHEETCLWLTSLPLAGFPYLTYQGRKIHLSAENWEGIGCEYRKYVNLKAGVGRKRKYLAA